MQASLRRSKRRLRIRSFWCRVNVQHEVKDLSKVNEAMFIDYLGFPKYIYKYTYLPTYLSSTCKPVYCAYSTSVSTREITLVLETIQYLYKGVVNLPYSDVAGVRH